MIADTISDLAGLTTTLQQRHFALSCNKFPIRSLRLECIGLGVTMRRVGHLVFGIVAVWPPLVPSAAWAWGEVAHRVICEIAFQELNDTARRGVVRLIKGDPEFRLFADSCIWPDHPRKRARERFINVPRSFSRFSDELCPIANACVFTAIRHDLGVLKNSQDNAAKLDSLKFLGHCVGDIHQPLHVSFADDLGGNKIKEQGAPCQFSLDSVWDTCIVNATFGTDVRAIGAQLWEQITDAEREKWRRVPLHGWANESFEITRAVSVGYRVLIGSKCVYEPGREAFDDGDAEKFLTVDQRYLDVHAPTIALRLKQAGVRLNELLNATLGTY